MADGSNLSLRLQHTFLHVVDVNIESQRMSRSKSDSSLSSSQRGNARVVDSDHIVFDTESSSQSQSQNGSIHTSGDISQMAPAPSKQSVDSGACSRDHAGPVRSTEQFVSEQTPSWSEGAQFHEHGYCRPCAWYCKPRGCENGAACTYCHMCGQDDLRSAAEGRRKARPRRHRQARPEINRNGTRVSLAEALSTDAPQLEHLADLECGGLIGMAAGALQQTDQLKQARSKGGPIPKRSPAIVSI